MKRRGYRQRLLRSIVGGSAACLTVVALAACSSSEPEPKPDPTRVVATITASGTANPNEAGRASPVLIRLYELTSESTFNAVSFFDLYDNETQALGGELRSREEIPLVPGQQTEIVIMPQEGSRFIGAAAAFQQIDTSLWRAVAEFPPNQTTRLAILVDGTTLTMTPVTPEAPLEAEE